jgi:phosphoglycolate phosphatase
VELDMTGRTMPTKVDAILFDKDGTLFDFRKSWGRWAASLLVQLTPDQTEQRQLGAAIGYDPVTDTFAPDSPVIAATPSEIAAALAPHYDRLSADQLEIRMNLLAAQAQMAPAVPLSPLLAALRGLGLKLGVATNDTQTAAEAHLAQAGVAQFFDHVMGCDSGYGSKPHPGMLLAFANRTGIAPHRIAMVGDSTHDALAPHADVVLTDISQLPAWLQKD